MKNCGKALVEKRVTKGDTQPAQDLRNVAELFLKLQQARNNADYDNSIIWGRSQAAELISNANQAIQTWMSISKEPQAQEFLFDLMGSPNR